MLGSIKRWVTSRVGRGDVQGVAEWAAQQGHGFKHTRSHEGFVIEQKAPARVGWRLEWGPAQRHYIGGAELRLRAELNAGRKLQMLVVSRSLMEALESQVFEQITEDLQTRADTRTPEEMRWLVLYARSGSFQQKALRERFGAVANAPDALAQWLTGPLEATLLDAQQRWLQPEEALALIVQRGRLVLRHAMPRVDIQRIANVVALYDVALEQARRVGELWGASGDAPSTHPSLWRTAAQPDEPPG